MKKTLSVILSLIMIISSIAALPFSAFALESEGSCGANVSYSFNSDTGVLTVSGTGEMANYDGGSSPFFASGDITRVVIEDGVTTVGYMVFMGCTNIESVYIPVSVVQIREYAFFNCSALTDIYYAGSETDWGNLESSIESNNNKFSTQTKHFDYSYSAPEPAGSCGEDAYYEFIEDTGMLVISGSGAMADFIENDPAYAYYKDSVTTIFIEDGITHIGYSAFYGFDKAESVRIANTVTSVGTYAFEGCSSLETISMAYGVCEVAPNAFKGTAITEFTFNNGTETIGGWAFEDCKSLKKVTISVSVKNINFAAFMGCTALTDVYYNGTEAQWQALNIAESNEALKNANIHYARSAKPLTTGSCGEKAKYSFNSSTGTLTISGKGEMADYNEPKDSPFYAHSEIKAIVIESGIETTGECAFNNLTGLKTVTLPNTLTTIGYYCFAYCTALTSINMPDSVISYGVDAFEGASNTFTMTSTCAQKAAYDDYIKGTNRKWNKTTHGGYKTTVLKATLAKNGSSVKKCACGEKKTTTIIYYPKTITLSASSYTYDGNAKKPTVSVKGSNGKTIAASNYTLTYSSGRKNVGEYAVKITFKGNYSGTKSLSFKINPKGTAVSKLTSPARKQIRVTWKKQASQTTGYQIQYSTDKTFKKGSKTVSVKGTANTNKTIGSLTRRKTYYVRIRTYKTIGNTKYYSAWKAYAKGIKVK